MTLGTKLVTSFLGCGLIPVGIVAVVIYNTADNGMDTILKQGISALETNAYNQLVAMREVKKLQVESYFKERQGDMGALVDTVGTLRDEAINKLVAVRSNKKREIERYFKDRLNMMTDVQKNLRFTRGIPAFSAVFSEGMTSDAYKRVHDARVAGLQVFCDIFGFNDVFLIDPQGDVVFSIGKGSDWGANLVNGSLKDSGLGLAFEHGKKATTFTDFSWYTVSNGPAAFISTPVRDDAGQFVGVAAFQVSLKEINTIMQTRAGLGETGETYLIGPDKLMRSDSILDPEHHSVASSFGNPSRGSVDTEAATAALSGKAQARVVMDYGGKPVLSAYTPIDIAGTRWALLAEIDAVEAFCPKDERGEYFFKNYADKYGYYDLLLMGPDGYCFYSVAMESALQTNFVDGKFSTSNLGQLVQNVLQTRSFGFADFKPNASNHGAPSAYIAQPFVKDGAVELVIALQIPLEGINGIMGVRAGLGETGETILVGQDYLMRSDSFRDPINHSVAGSFANPSTGKVDTDATRAAIERGEDGIAIVTDYIGNEALIAYGPIDVLGTTWCMNAKIDEAEALAAVVDMKTAATVAGTKLFTWVGTLGVIAAALVTFVSVWIARSISKPINRIIDGLNEGADQVNDAAAQVSTASQQSAEGASEQASSLEETSSALEEMAAMTRTNAENSKEANALSAQARDAAQSGDKTMHKLNEAMAAINESSGQISKIIKVIEEIAFQTNLLALNAAVEAARAGEHGKGFAVVADEVRNLAQRAAQAAGETTALIENSVGKAKEGAEVATEVGKALATIVGDVSKVTDLIDGISKASEEQALGVDQVNTAVSQMDKVTQQNAAGAEESASAAEQLSAQANTVKGVVTELASIVNGAGAGYQSSRKNPRPGRSGSKPPAKTASRFSKRATSISESGTMASTGKAGGHADPVDEFMSMDDMSDMEDF